MSIRKQKSYIVAISLFKELPDRVKDALGSVESVEQTSTILSQAQLPENARIPLNDIVYGLFIGEFPPSLLTDVIKEEMRLEEAKAQLVAALVRKTFVEPHIEFLTNLYQDAPKINPKSPLVPQGNVVNLAKPKASL